VDVVEQIAVTVEEGPVDAGAPGDPGNGDGLAFRAGGGDGGEDPLAVSFGLGSPAFDHGGDTP